MRMERLFHRLLFAAALAAAACAASSAGESCAISFSNRLDEEIVDIRVKYATPHGEPRFDRSRVGLAPGGEYRVGVQGVSLPELIAVDLATKTYLFEDLSGIGPADRMRLEIAHEEGAPRLRRVDAEGAAKGAERDYLTAANRSNAVDKDDVMEASNLEEALRVVRERIEEAREDMGGLEKFTVEAGPIWNQDHALRRCPEVAEEWSGDNGREARWNGHWWTTVPGQMSVCECLTGTAGEEDTIAFEDKGWGRTAYFPVFWLDWGGVGYIVNDVPGGGTAVAMRFRIPPGDAAEALDELLKDLGYDGFRPARFEMEAANLDADGDEEKSLGMEIDFREEKDDADDAHNRVLVALTAAYSKTVVRAALAWVEEDAFEESRTGGGAFKGRGVLCLFSKGIFEAIFMPDGSFLMR